MELYAPMSSEEVEQIERREGFEEGTWYFVEKPDPDEAGEDAVWVLLEIPEAEVIAYENPRAAERGYREFEVPGAIASRFPVRRASSL